MPYLLNAPDISRLEKKYVSDVLKNKWLSSNGLHTKKFEKKICEYLNLNFSLAVQSGTAALHVALKSLGCKPGDNIILPNYSCVSNLSAVTQCGANPVIVEIEQDTLGLDIDDLKKAIKIYKPKVVQLVHIYGYPAKYTKDIKNICKKKGIYLLEDFSEALGAEINNKKIGTFGDIAVFSIRSEKMIGVGEGGVVVSNNKKIFDKVKTFASRNSPYRSKKDPYWKKYYCAGEGYNYMLPHLLGAVARAQIERFKKELLPKKIQVGKIYKSIFNETNLKMTQKNILGHKAVFWLNSIYFKNTSKEKVKKIASILEKNNIEIRSGFWPLNDMKGFKSKYVGTRKITREIFDKTLVLPSNIYLKKKDILKFKNLIIKNI